MLTWLAYTHLVPPHILCQAKNIISLKQCNGLSFFRDFDISMKVIGTTAPVAHCELSASANRRSGEVNFARQPLWDWGFGHLLVMHFFSRFRLHHQFYYLGKNSHLKLPPFFIKSIICFVESLSESWCCLIICIMSFPSSAHVQEGEGALWWEGNSHQTQQTTAHHNSQCPPAAAGTLVEIFKKKCQSVNNIFRLILPWRRTRWSTSTSGSWTRTWRSLNRRWRWDQDQVSRRLPSPLCLFRTRDGCRRARARRRRWSTRRRWRTRRRRESRRRTTRRRRRPRRWEGGGKRKDFAMFFPQVENLTTPLISYVGSGVPQEVLDMPVDPNEPTYCVCQQVSNYMWRILHLVWCYIS